MAAALIDPEEAHERALARWSADVDRAEHDLGLFITMTTPAYDEPEHLRPLLDALDRSMREPVYALVECAPRHAKTETLLHGLARRLKYRSEDHVAYCSYAAPLALRKSRRAREMASRAGVWTGDEKVTRNRFDPSQAVSYWQTIDGGSFTAGGRNSGFTGDGYQVVVYDDPLKPLAADTPIPTPKGWTTMGELRPGDRVFDHAGRPTRVVRVTKKRKAPRMRVWFSDRSYVDTHPGHLWKTFDRRAQDVFTHDNRRYTPDWWWWKNTGGSAVSEVTTSTIAGSLIARKTMRNWTIPTAFPLKLRSAKLPVDPYILGYWLGDGDSRDPIITCAEWDLPHLKSEVQRAGYHVLSTANTVRASTKRISISAMPKRTNKWEGTSLIALLRKLGVRNNKHVPTKYLRGSAAQRLAILQGLFDSDGSSGKQGESVFTTKCVALADGVAELIVSLGGKCGRRSITYDHGVVHYVRGFFPFCPFRLPRKAAGYVPDGQIRRTNRTIVGVEKLEVTEHLCIEVEAESHLFLAGRSMIPTCNSREEAESPVYQEKAIETWRGLANRIEPGGSAFISHQPWNDQDVIALLKAEQVKSELDGDGHKWEIISLPAVIDAEYDEQGRLVGGTPLWPARWSLRNLARRKHDVGEYNWFSQYTLDRRPRGDQIFGEPARYVEPVIGGAVVVISCDPGIEENKMRDSSGIVVGSCYRRGGPHHTPDKPQLETRIDILSAEDQWRDVPDLLDYLEQMQRVTFRGAPILLEEVSAFKALSQVAARLNPKLRLYRVTPRGSKFLRAQPTGVAWNAGRIRVPFGGAYDGAWVPDFIREMQRFTGKAGGKDNRVDALTQLFDYAGAALASVAGAESGGESEWASSPF